MKTFLMGVQQLNTMNKKLLILVLTLVVILLAGCDLGDMSPVLEDMIEADCDPEDPADICGPHEYCVSMSDILNPVTGEVMISANDACIDPDMYLIRLYSSIMEEPLINAYGSELAALDGVGESVNEISCRADQDQNDCSSPSLVVLWALIKFSGASEFAECSEVGEEGFRCYDDDTKYCDEDNYCSECATDDHCVDSDMPFCISGYQGSYCGACKTDEDCSYGYTCRMLYAYEYHSNCMQDSEVSDIDILAHEAPEFPAYLGIIALLAAITIALLISKRK